MSITPRKSIEKLEWKRRLEASGTLNDLSTSSTFINDNNASVRSRVRLVASLGGRRLEMDKSHCWSLACSSWKAPIQVTITHPTNQHPFSGDNSRKQPLISCSLKASEDREEEAAEAAAASLAAAAANEISASDAFLFFFYPKQLDAFSDWKENKGKDQRALLEKINKGDFYCRNENRKDWK